MKLEDDKYCFACGSNNPIGLKLNFEYDEHGVRIAFTPVKEHQGWYNVTHGGIIATLIDEAMANIIIHSGKFAVTSNMEVRFLRPANTGEELIVTGRIKSIDGKKIKAESRVTCKGKIIASGRGTYIEI